MLGSHLEKATIDIFNGIIISPDFDIKVFITTVITGCEQLRTQIPNCDLAFDVIKNSAYLFDDKFDEYYKKYIDSGNPSIIIESFIIDVSIKQKISVDIINQYRKITMKLMQLHGDSDNPNIKFLISTLDKNIDIIETQYETNETNETYETNISTASRCSIGCYIGYCIGCYIAASAVIYIGVNAVVIYIGC
jgi:hypothetical protein